MPRNTGARPDESLRGLTVRSLVFRAATANEEDMSVEAVMSTETPAVIWDWNRGETIDEILKMRGCRRGEQVVMLDAHAAWSIDDVFGSWRDLRVEGNELVGRACYSDDEKGKRAFGLVRDGHVTDVSIGYSVNAEECVYIAPGETAVVDGENYTAGKRWLRITRDWELMECSLVPVGADPNAKFRGATMDESGCRSGDEQGAESRVNEPEIKESEMKRMQVFREAARDAGGGGGGTPSEPVVLTTEQVDPGIAERARAEGGAAETRRVSAILALCRKHDVSPEVQDKLIQERMSVQDAGLRILDEVAARREPAVPVIQVGADRSEDQQRAISDAISMTCRAYRPENTKHAEAAREFSGITVRQVMEIAVERDLGRRLDVMERNPQSLIKRALSTVSFPALMGDAMHKVLIASFQQRKRALLQVCATSFEEDFRETSEISYGDFSTFGDISNGREFPSGGVRERVVKRSTALTGVRFDVTYEMLRNDNLGVIMAIPQAIGNAGGDGLNRKVGKLLTSNGGVGPEMTEDSVNLFSASHPIMTGSAVMNVNYLDGAASALSVDGLAAAIKALRTMKGVPTPEGDAYALNFEPRYLLVPATLEFTANKLTQSELLLMSTGTNATVTDGNRNVHYHIAEPVVDAMLDGETNGTTAWYLFADPNVPGQAALKISYLSGMELPVVERRDSVDSLSIGFVAYHAAKVNAVDYRPVIRCKGTT